jgi:predicted AAA+ superfamily ATPase
LHNLPSRLAVDSHPKLGASWGGFALEQAIRLLRIEPGEAFYWATHAGAELDLLLTRGGKRYGFEFKRADAPRTSRSMRSALADLMLERLFVIYPGETNYALDERIEVFALRHLGQLQLH